MGNFPQDVSRTFAAWNEFRNDSCTACRTAKFQINVSQSILLSGNLFILWRRSRSGKICSFAERHKYKPALTLFNSIWTARERFHYGEFLLYSACSEGRICCVVGTPGAGRICYVVKTPGEDSAIRDRQAFSCRRGRWNVLKQDDKRVQRWYVLTSCISISSIKVFSRKRQEG